MENENQKSRLIASVTEEEYLECEKRWVFATLMFVGGFLGGFTYTIRGGIFCNAQTGNFVLFAIALGNTHWSEALYYFIPMSAYLLGAVISEAIATPIKKLNIMRWDTLFIIVEMLIIASLGFVPESAPFQISQVAINFICSMQYNTFRQAQGIPMATTFCTNHLRQVGVGFAKTLRHKDRQYMSRAMFHLSMLLIFVIGGVIATVLCNIFLGKAIWFALIPLAVVLFDFLYADFKKEKGSLNKIPHGH